MAHHRNGLAERRRTVGLTQEALAEHMRVDRSTITRWESGRTAPQPWMRPRLARLLRVDAEGLNNLLSPRTSHGAEGQDALAYATLHPERVDLLAVATLRTRFDDYAARYDRVPSALPLRGRQHSSIASTNSPPLPIADAFKGSCTLCTPTRALSWGS